MKQIRIDLTDEDVKKLEIAFPGMRSTAAIRVIFESWKRDPFGARVTVKGPEVGITPDEMRAILDSVKS